jgi:hypothetical protein
MATIECKVDIPPVRGLEDSTLTVGRVFYLNCSGDWPSGLKIEALHFVNVDPLHADAFKYEIKLLKFEFRSPHEADLQVTSHLTGVHQFRSLLLTDGTTQVDLGTIQYQVQSVIAKDQAKVEPYGPIGPANIPVPPLYWLSIVVLVTAGLLTLGYRFWRFRQRKAMLERLKQHDVALSPLQEFHQSMRRLQRANAVFYGKEASVTELQEGLQELTRMFKKYLSRRLKIPAFEWGDRLIMKDLRRYHRALYLEHGRKLQDLLQEFKKAEGTPAQLRAEDITQLAERLRKTLETTDRFVADTDTKRGGQ